tara:strand:- start:1887 stop:2339 length:453 start_codon:yes stop_codon:yes gene_type:complete
MKKLIIFLIIILIPGCGFEPIYSTKNNFDYKLNTIERKGDSSIDNLIATELQRLSNDQSNKLIDIEINTSYEKKIISKDSKGSVSDYQININTKFLIIFEEKELIFQFSDKQNIKNISDIFEQKNYENIIKKNFANSAVRKLNLELVNNL